MNKIVILDLQIIYIFFDPKFMNNNILYFYSEINVMLKNKLDIEDDIYHEKDIFLEKRKNGENDTLACKIIQTPQL